MKNIELNQLTASQAYQRLFEIALENALEGDIDSIFKIIERVEGLPAQHITITHENGHST